MEDVAPRYLDGRCTRCVFPLKVSAAVQQQPTSFDAAVINGKLRFFQRLCANCPSNSVCNLKFLKRVWMVYTYMYGCPASTTMHVIWRSLSSHEKIS